MKTKVLVALLVVLLGIQLVRPARNLSAAVPGPNDITVLYPTPSAVKAALARACYDCHSDHTRYPWYANFQPVGWWLANHIHDGKRHLNFSAFGTYDPRQAVRKMKQTIDQLNEHEMPLESYLWIHRDADLSDADRTALADWARSVGRQVAAK